MVQVGFDPGEFDLIKAVYHPSGQAVFLPLKEVNLDELPALIGVLYAKKPVTLKGKQIPAGLHPVRIISISSNAKNSKNGQLISLYNDVSLCWGVSIGEFIAIQFSWCKGIQHDDENPDGGEPGEPGNCNIPGWAGGCPA